MLYLYDGCDTTLNQPWVITEVEHIGRRHINIGTGGDSEVQVRFNIGKKTGKYYLAVQAKDGGIYSASPYKIHLELQTPNFTTVKTLILYNPSRFKQAYSLDATSNVMDKLVQLAQYPTVDGAILQLDQFPAVVDAYNALDNTSVSSNPPASYVNNVDKANMVSVKIRDAMQEFLQGNNLLVTDYVVIVGDDDQIPFRRLNIQSDLIIPDTDWVSEKTYFEDSLGNDIPNTPIDAALMTNQTLSDDYYGDYQDRPGAEYLPSFAVGRLLDTPERISNTIETFIDNNGVIDLTMPQSKKAAVAGYDFLANAAQEMCDYLTLNGGLITDCAIDTPVAPNKFTGANLYQKFIINTPNVTAYYGHTSHDTMFTPLGAPLSASQISGASVDLPHSLWWIVGCHSGLVMPDSEHYSLSLTQALSNRGITYIGNTGWAYGSDGPPTYSELLYKYVARKLVEQNGITIGEALRQAKEHYYFTAFNNAYGKGNNISYYDTKIMSEATLYGLPMLQVKFPFVASLQSDSLLSEPVMTKSNSLGPTIPSQFHTYDLGPGVINNGDYSATPNHPLLPISLIDELHLALGTAKGVIWIGGSYNIYTNTDPLIIKPWQLNSASGAEPEFNGTYPLVPVTLLGLQNVDGTLFNRMSYQTQQFIGNETNGTLRLFTNMDFRLGLWDGSGNDGTPPTIGQMTSSVVNNNLHIELPITDTSGIYEAYVTYTELNNSSLTGSWQSDELLADGVDVCTSGQHTYSLDIPFQNDLSYFIQVMDCNGNVSVKTNNKKYYQTSSSYSSVTFKSQNAQDGWILESSEASNKGGTMNSTANLLYVGDNAQDRQYKSILSFDTSSLPVGAVVTNVQLKINIKAFTGGNMFTLTKTLGNLLMDIRKSYFGANANLAVGDFQSAANKNSVGKLASAPAAGWYTVTLNSTAYPFVNLTGTTQFRLRFKKDDNDDLGADYLKIYSGDAGDVNSPQLIVEYYVP